MKNRDDALLRKINEYCDEAQAAIDMFGNDYDIFLGNTIYRNACCMPIMQIGELCKLISDEMREEHKEVDWKGWCGVRDIIAHQYTNLDYSKAWEMVCKDLPKLKAAMLIIVSDIDKYYLSRITNILDINCITGISAEEVYSKITVNTGISMNAFTDDKLLEYIKTL